MKHPLNPYLRPRFDLLAVVGAAALLAACGGGGGGGSAIPEAQAVAVLSADKQAEFRELPLATALPPLRPAPAGLAGNVICDNLLIGAVMVDNVEVPSGKACELTGTIVRGSVQVAPGAVLLAGGALQVAGSVQGAQAAHLQVAGLSARIAGNFQAEGGGSATLTGAQVGGDVFVNGLTSVVSLKDTRVSGNMQVTDNLGGSEIIGNRISGNLQCTGNVPTPLASNNTAALIENQCLPGGSGGGGTPPAPPLSGNVTCVNLSIGAIRLDSVIVPAGASCALLGTQLNGSIEVGAAAQLNATNVAVTGNLLSDGAASLRLSGASRIGGSVQVQRGASAELTGASVAGNLQIDAMTGPVLASGNNVTGNLQAVGNRGGLTLNSNRMGGVMQCKENLPAPTGAGNIATLKEDQCLNL